MFQEPRVLLRRDRSVCGQKRTFNAPPGFPLASLGDMDRAIAMLTSYAAKATAQLTSEPPRRRVVLRRSVARRHWAAADLVAAVGPTRRRSARSTTAAISRRSATTACISTTLAGRGALRARRYNKIAELPSVDTWRITDQTVTPTAITGGIGGLRGGQPAASTSSGHGQVHEHLRRSSDQVRRSGTTTWSTSS